MILKKIPFFLAFIISISCLRVIASDTSSNPQLHSPEIALSNFIKIPSITGQEQLAADYFSDLCKKAGLKVEYFTNQKGKINFAASLYSLETNKPNIVLLNHLDVVPALDSLWEVPPFSGKIDNEFIWGRGAIDMKGMAIMQLYALQSFINIAENQELDYNVTILSVSGEEEGGHNGAEIIVENHLEKLNPIVVLGEGGSGLTGLIQTDSTKTFYGISLAEKSSLWLKLSLKSKSYGHGAAAPDHHANKEMVKALYKLNNLKDDYKFTPTTRKMFNEIGKLESGIIGFVIKKINWVIFQPLIKREVKKEPVLRSMISNTAVLTQYSNPPGPPNIISSEATAYLDCRLLPGTNPKRYIRDLKLKLFNPKIKFEIIEQSPIAKHTKPDVFYDYLAEAIDDVHPGMAVVPVLFPATSDNSYFRAAGIPTYGLNPINQKLDDLSRVHGANERLRINDLYDGIKIYRSFLARALNVDDENNLLIPSQVHFKEQDD